MIVANSHQNWLYSTEIEESHHCIIAQHVHPLQNMNRFQYDASRGRTSADLWLERVKTMRAGFSRTLPPIKTSLTANCQYLTWRCIHLFRQLEIKKPLNASLHLHYSCYYYSPCSQSSYFTDCNQIGMRLFHRSQSSDSSGVFALSQVSSAVVRCFLLFKGWTRVDLLYTSCASRLHLQFRYVVIHFQHVLVKIVMMRCLSNAGVLHLRLAVAAAAHAGQNGHEQKRH